MKPISLTLKGFRGIRDGLSRDTLTLDFEHRAGDAQLIAIVGKNGRGKTTVMDNMTPYPVMPSRAGADGLGGFSYYDQVCLPESVKDLVWEHGGHRYRSQLVFRINGKKKTEAFLHIQTAGGWTPVALHDGTVSDGKGDTYLRCVEAILGSAETFFTSAFSAQCRRQLSSYKNAEIKTLLADLLGLDHIRALGAKAAETVKLVKAGLNAVRQERGGLQADIDRVEREFAQLGDATERVEQAKAHKARCLQAVDNAKEALAAAKASRETAQHNEARRSQLLADRRSLIETGTAAVAALDQQDRREADRLDILDKRIAKRAEELNIKRKNLSEQRQKLLCVTRRARQIERANRRLPQAQRVVTGREERLGQLRAELEKLHHLLTSEKHARERIRGLEREAWQAVLKAQELARRFGLTAEVPCAGTGLQGECKLLADAHEAKTLQPSADLQVKRLETEQAALITKLEAVLAESAGLKHVPKALQIYEGKVKRARAKAEALAMLAARCDELARATESLAEIEDQIQASATVDHGETALEKEERANILRTRESIASQRAADAKRYREMLNRIDEAIAKLPAPLDEATVTHALCAVERAQHEANAADAAFLQATRDQQRAQSAQQQKVAYADRMQGLDTRIADIEDRIGVWTLFAKCMSNDGLIALSIDDAGPTLASLANDLLLACYGPRFTVSIKTQVETGKGEVREGFDIVVHDAESGTSKSVTLMSGGERVWINECLIRAIALYLAQNAGRRYETLFSDEADGPLDPERKRMFMAMKREVLRIGGYQQEYFVSQTPELTAMADAVIDLEALRVEPHCIPG